MGDVNRFRRKFQRMITRYAKDANDELLLAMEEECQKAAQMARQQRCNDEPCNES